MAVQTLRSASQAFAAAKDKPAACVPPPTPRLGPAAAPIDKALPAFQLPPAALGAAACDTRPSKAPVPPKAPILRPMCEPIEKLMELDDFQLPDAITGEIKPLSEVPVFAAAWGLQRYGFEELCKPWKESRRPSQGGTDDANEEANLQEDYVTYSAAAVQKALR